MYPAYDPHLGKYVMVDKDLQSKSYPFGTPKPPTQTPNPTSTTP